MIRLDLPRRTAPRPAAPAAAQAAAAARRRSVYAAAMMSRLTQDWYASILSADQEIKGDLRALRARSRQLIRDNGHAARFIQLVRQNVVGPEGIALQPQIRRADGALDVDLNAHIDEQWIEWGFPETATADRRLSWTEFVRLAAGTVAADGEAIVRLLPGFRNDYAFAVQLLDADQLDETYNVAPAPGRNEVRMGVELDEYGGPVAYWFWTRHPSEDAGRRERVRIPADQILHLFVPLRPGQTRGIPWLTPAMLAMKMLDGYQEAELVAARAVAAKPVLFKTSEKFAEAWAPNVDAPEEDEDFVMEVEPGLMRALPLGLEAQQLDPQHPVAAFSAFQSAILRAIAAGANVAYTSLTNDLTAVNYGSMRGGLLDERDGWRVLQQWIAVHLCRPVYRRWLPFAQLAGRVELPSADARRWSAATWRPRGWDWVDPLNDVQTAEHEIAARLNSRTRICQARGRNFEQVLAELAAEQELADAWGVDLSVATKAIVAPAPDPAAGGADASGPDGADAGAAGDAGDAGASGKKSAPRPRLAVAP